MAEVNKGPLSTILVYSDSTESAGQGSRQEGVDNNKTRSYAGLILRESAGSQKLSLLLLLLLLPLLLLLLFLLLLLPREGSGGAKKQRRAAADSIGLQT